VSTIDRSPASDLVKMQTSLNFRSFREHSRQSLQANLLLDVPYPQYLSMYRRQGYFVARSDNVGTALVATVRLRTKAIQKFKFAFFV